MNKNFKYEKNVNFFKELPMQQLKETYLFYEEMNTE